MSYLDAAANNAGSAAETAAERETAKYADLENRFFFQLTVVESLGTKHESAQQFPVDLAHKIPGRSGDDCEGSYLLSFKFRRVELQVEFRVTRISTRRIFCDKIYRLICSTILAGISTR